MTAMVYDFYYYKIKYVIEEQEKLCVEKTKKEKRNKASIVSNKLFKIILNVENELGVKFTYKDGQLKVKLI